MSDAPETVYSALCTTAMEGVFLMQEAASVLVLRSAALSGLRPLAPDEALRMFAEKPPAFAAAMTAAWIAAATGRRADEVVAAALRPLRREARANVARLSRF